MGTLRIHKMQLFVLPEVQGLSGMDLIADRLHEVLESNSIIAIVIKVAENLVDLGIGKWKTPVMQIKFELLFFNAFVVILVEVPEALSCGFPVLSYFCDKLLQYSVLGPERLRRRLLVGAFQLLLLLLPVFVYGILF